MLNGELREEHLPLDQLRLDPNNPRFADLDVRGAIPENRVHEDSVQERAMSRIADDRFEVEALMESIENIGFLQMDRLVAVRLPQNDFFMVIEGNRRLAALKLLLKREASGEVDLAPDIRKTLSPVPVLIIESEDPSVRDKTARILQGVRHLASVKPWGPYQQAQLVALMLQEGSEIIDVKEVLGLSTQRVNGLRRVHAALEQMRGDIDWSDLFKPNLFSHFDEALKQPAIRKWLDWDDGKGRIGNDDHRALLYSWIVGMEEEGERFPPKVNDARDFRHLPSVLNDPVQAQRFSEDPRLSLRDAARGVSSDEPAVDWRAVLQSNLSSLRQVPAVELAEAVDSDLELLARVRDLAAGLIHQVELMRGDQKQPR